MKPHAALDSRVAGMWWICSKLAREGRAAAVLTGDPRPRHLDVADRFVK